MRPLRILLCPAGSAGDVHPFVPIGQALKARGHDVIIVTSAYFEDLIRRVGLDFVPVGTPEQFRSVIEHPSVWHPVRSYPRLVRALLPLAREACETITGLMEPERTVIAAPILAFGARIAAERHGIPMATVHLQPACFVSAYDPLALPVPLPQPGSRLLRRAVRRLVDHGAQRLLAPEINHLRGELGLPPARHILTEWLHSPDRVIGLFPEWFAQPQPDWPPQTRLTGFPLYDESDVTSMPDDLSAFLDAGEPPIAFTPGSANLFGGAFFEAAADACTRLGRRGILLTRNPEQVPGVLPSEVRHCPYAPFGKLLPRCAALVHHGGIGTAAQGLAAGIPHLVMPLAFDQPDNARRLGELGVARSLPPKRFRGPAVARVLDELLRSEEVARSCRGIAERMRADDPVPTTCDLIEALA